MNNSTPSGRSSSIAGPILAAGFAGALAVWCTWFLAPLSWVSVPENPAIVVAAVLWLMAVAVCLRGAKPSFAVGIGSGLIAALMCVIPLASKLRPAGSKAAPLDHPLPTDAWKIVLLFLAAGAAIGLIGSLLARAMSKGTDRQPSWLVRFAIVASLAVAPLLFFGGLVTSTGSGMAVPDWPTTFGAQMFFYPMGSETDPDVYLEHTHRLFGTLVGMSALLLMVWTLFSDRSRWAKRYSVAVFIFVCLQGVLGGMRVWLQTHLGGDDPAAAASIGRTLAFVHGVLAQLVFGSVVALAAYVSPTFGNGRNTTAIEIDPARARRMRIFATAALHSLILQLLFGAMARHFRATNHAVWMHAAFSLVVMGAGLIAGFMATSIHVAPANRGVTILRRLGVLMVVIVTLQFLLGWAALGIRGKDIKAETAVEALVRTAHQANGALLLAATSLGFVWARWLWRSVAKVPVTTAVEPKPTTATTSARSQGVTAA